MSLAAAAFFHNFFNKKYVAAPFFSKAMRAACLAQEALPGWLPAKRCLLNLEAIGSDGQGGGIAFAGWIFRSAMALTLSWALGYAIASVPGLSQALQALAAAGGARSIAF